MRKSHRTLRLGLILLLGGAASACVSSTPDYSAYLEHMPASILVLPPLNSSPEVSAPGSYLSTITQPLAEQGYYVFPVAVVDAVFKDNGIPEPGEMHRVPLSKLDEIFGADAVLYIEITDWGASYQVVQSVTRVTIKARLVDIKTGTPLWAGAHSVSESSGTSNNLVASLVVAAATQVAESLSDGSRPLAVRANNELMRSRSYGLLLGQRNPGFAEDQKDRREALAAK